MKSTIIWIALALTLTGCGNAYEEKGLCSYLGTCEGKKSSSDSTDHNTLDHSVDHGAPGQDDSGQ